MPEQTTSRVEEFRANPTRALWKLSMPIFGGMIIHTLYSVVDMIFVGWVGPNAVAAMAFNLPLVFFAFGIVMGLSSGVTAVLAQAIGAKDKERADNTAEHAIVMGLVLGGMLFVSGLVYGPRLLAFLGATDEINALGWQYLQVITFGIPFSVMSGFLRGIMVGEGDTVRPMTIMGAGMIANIILDPIFIFALDQGVRGAAIATAISQVMVFIVMIYLLVIKRSSYVHFKMKNFRFKTTILLGISKIGLPASFSFIIMASGAAIYNRILVSFSPHAVAAYQMASRIEMIYFMPLIAVATGSVTLVGMFYGAGAMDEVKNIIKYALSRAIVYGFVFSAVIILFAPVLMQIFKPNAEILGYSVSYLRINALAFPIAPIGLISARVLQGLGKGLPFLVVTTLRVVGLGAPFAYFFVFVQNRPIEWIWISMVISMIGGAMVGGTWLVTTLRSKSKESIPSAPAGDQPAVAGTV